MAKLFSLGGKSADSNLFNDFSTARKGKEQVKGGLYFDIVTYVNYEKKRE
jgi:hypothetical protein